MFQILNNPLDFDLHNLFISSNIMFQMLNYFLEIFMDG